MKYLLHRVVRKLVNIYKKTDGKLLCNQLERCGSGVNIIAPQVFGYPENISIGDNTVILDGARLQVYPDLVEENPKISIGKNCYFTYRTSILAGGDIIIGDNVLFASDVTLCSHNHGTDPESSKAYMDQHLIVGDIKIGNNCWLGNNVIVLAGVTIGDGVVVGAGSIVTKDIPSHCVAAGNPARIIKRYNFLTREWENE